MIPACRATLLIEESLLATVILKQFLEETILFIGSPTKIIWMRSSREIPFEMYGAENVLAEGISLTVQRGYLGQGNSLFNTKHNSYEGYSFIEDPLR